MKAIVWDLTIELTPDVFSSNNELRLPVSSLISDRYGFPSRISNRFVVVTFLKADGTLWCKNHAMQCKSGEFFASARTALNLIDRSWALLRKEAVYTLRPPVHADTSMSESDTEKAQRQWLYSMGLIENFGYPARISLVLN